jgi:GTPase SAR1 family protein
MKEEIYTYFVGTAGSGKSTLTATFQDWFNLRGLDAITVNLDPGAENLPYKPDVDIRDWISLHEIMKTHNLGPNGAQIACADMFALNTNDVKQSIDSFKADYILIDTPGQIELFVFREAGKYIVQFMQPEKSVICFLIDPSMARSPSGFVSQLLLSITTNFRLNQPQINILSKADMIPSKIRNLIKKWSEDPDELYGAVFNEDPSLYRNMHEKILTLIKELGGYIQLVQTGKEAYFGIEDLYATIQLIFEGGEDLLKD